MRHLRFGWLANSQYINTYFYWFLNQINNVRGFERAWKGRLTPASFRIFLSRILIHSVNRVYSNNYQNQFDSSIYPPEPELPKYLKNSIQIQFNKFSARHKWNTRRLKGAESCVTLWFYHILPAINTKSMLTDMEFKVPSVLKQA